MKGDSKRRAAHCAVAIEIAIITLVRLVGRKSWVRGSKKRHGDVQRFRVSVIHRPNPVTQALGTPRIYLKQFNVRLGGTEGHRRESGWLLQA
jgi:hypothetical protein